MAKYNDPRDTVVLRAIVFRNVLPVLEVARNKWKNALHFYSEVAILLVFEFDLVHQFNKDMFTVTLQIIDRVMHGTLNIRNTNNYSFNILVN